MKPLGKEAFLLTDAEVLELLKDRGAVNTLKEGSRASPIERQVAEYLEKRGVDAGPEAMARLPAARDQLVALGLTKLEVLQVLNLRPTKVVEAYVCLSNVEERGLDMEDLLEASKRKIVHIVESLAGQG